MASTVRTGRYSIEESSLIGLGVGGGLLAIYLVAGFLFAEWSLSDFFSHLTLTTTAWAVIFSGVVIAGIALPITLYLRYGLRFPLGVLLISAVGWFAFGTITGGLTIETAFGFTLYLWMFSPVLVALELVIGGGEYYTRNRGYLS